VGPDGAVLEKWFVSTPCGNLDDYFPTGPCISSPTQGCDGGIVSRIIFVSCLGPSKDEPALDEIEVPVPTPPMPN
jgi:hypothetical protein